MKFSPHFFGGQIFIKWKVESGKYCDAVIRDYHILPAILNHAELEEKNKDLYDVQKVHRFALPIKIGNKNFFTLITVKQRNDYEKANIDEFAIYDLSSKTNEMLDRNWQDETSKPHSQASTISITDLVDFVNTHLNKYRKSLHQNNNIQYQSMTKEQLLNVYMNQEFGMSADDITDMVTEDIKSILTDYDVSEDEFKFEDIRIYGSYSKGTNKVGSDLDIVVQYSGSMREDSAFNMLHDEELSIYDEKGNKVKIDINPINTADHGTIDDYSKILFQSAYHGSPHKFDKFSTDNIGTGEGAQAHGWGLYFAENKEISDNYREKLTNYKKRTFYQGEENNSTEENIKGSRGFTYQRETALNVIENIIVLLNNKADKSTLLHEFGHVYLQVMNDLARTNSKARERVLTIDKWLRHEQGSEYTTAQHEKFAR